MEVCDRPWCNGITQKNKRDVRDVSVVYEKGSVKKRKGVWLAFFFGRGRVSFPLTCKASGTPTPAMTPTTTSPIPAVRVNQHPGST